MRTRIVAVLGDDFRVSLSIETDCPNIERIKVSLGPVDPVAEVSGGIGGSAVYEWAKGLPHAACPVPCALVKCVEAEGGLGLKRNVSMTFADRAAAAITIC